MSQELISVLSDISFLDEVSACNIESIATVATLKTYAPGTIIYHEGQKEDQLHLIVDGRVSLEFCAPGVGCKRFQTVGDGDLIAWSPLLHLQGLMATARALEVTRTVAIDAKQLKARFEQDPQLGYEFMSRVAAILAQRLGATRLQLLQVSPELLPVGAAQPVGAETSP